MIAERYSAARLGTLHTCLRRYYYRYILGLIEPSTDAQSYGKGMHRGLEAWLLHFDEGSDARLAAAISALALPDPVDAAKARAMLVGYEARWGSAPWRVLAVEVPFSYELGGFFIDGAIDAIVQDTTDGRTYVVEHKNTAADTSPGSSYWEVLAIDRQVSIYVDAATMLGYDIAGVIYDALARPKHELLKATPEGARTFTLGKGCKACGGKRGVRGTGCADCYGHGWSEAPRLNANQREQDETFDEYEARVMSAIADKPEAFYQRATIVRTEDELPRMRTDIVDTIKLARLCTALETWPRGNSSACRSYGSVCSFLPICSGAASPDDPRFPRRESAPSQP